MGFLLSKKGSLISDYFLLLDDVGQLKGGNMVDLALYDDHLELLHLCHQLLSLSPIRK